ncbi:N-6 DNA methylase [Hyphomicrobium sp.]|uniref:N-6 DNA methylase n=1 Tax=Hyphomicrobium sp. TaxID=82 RepID=UPI002D790EC5|nr:N-6 DNA methylase [Hyphomicrobium sp.]HET6388223.1 N-6 DNA methylase [Hyphomicrobium sp.]
MLDLLQRLISRDAPRTEADVQADVRQLFLTAPFQLDEGDLIVNLEAQVGDRRRIDVEAGSTVVEVKRDLRKGKVKTEALEQLGGYVEKRITDTGRRYVGVLTDGAEWICYHLVGKDLKEVAAITVTGAKGDLERLVFWLEGVLATAKDILPTAREIAARLGARSSAYALDRATLATLFETNKKNPTVRLKRTLWSRLLTSALGTQFDDSDDLFIEHTLLVNSAEIIAHAVLGLPVEGLNPASLLTGTKFDESGVYGVVEADFFDWVLEVDGGEEFVRALARRLARFNWSHVEQDVMKVLYESVIGAETRKRLGEYYTPDWLAEAMVEKVIDKPLEMRVLDTACGSGTFLFHAIRRYIAAAEAEGQSLGEVLENVTQHVLGMDLHPVAVTLARVTYLLAIGRERLMDEARGTIQVPVYLGDSIQWQEQQLDLWTAGNLVIHADDKKELFTAELRFPDSLLENAALFDQLVNELAARASSKKKGAPPPSLTSVYQRLAIPQEARATVDATFKTMCRLHDEGRDHIWGYYVRNLARPMWLSRDQNRVDVLIGNPPWLAYRHMTAEMQKVFRSLSETRGLWAGADVATHQDLSALFVVRASELYLKKGGKFAMVLPNAAVDRVHYEGFRRGHYKTTALNLAFEESWDLRRIRPHFFPRGASVVFGTRGAEAKALPDMTEYWSGKVGGMGTPWQVAKGELIRTTGTVHRIDRESLSHYHAAFTQGAIFAPRIAFFVQKQKSSPLGLPAGRMAVVSERSPNEKKPWKDLESLAGVVESEFVRQVLSGENLLPYRISADHFAVVPCDTRQLLKDGGAIELYPGLEQWWGQAQRIWEKHRQSERLSLFEQLDYQSKLTKQLPIAALRVVYNKSGMHLVAAKVKHRRALVSNGLYWAAVASEAEADFLCAVLNAPATTDAVRPLMSYGKDERDIHKHVWQLPIPKFDEANSTHQRVVAIAKVLEQIVAGFPVNDTLHFAATRRHIREKLEETAEAQELNDLVFEMLE